MGPHTLDAAPFRGNHGCHRRLRSRNPYMAIIRIAGWVHPVFSSVVSIFFAYTTLATRNLYDESKKVLRALEQGDLNRARKEVGFLVGRDTDHLDEKEICRALIETVSENTSDGIVAPLFYLLIGGPLWRWPTSPQYSGLHGGLSK